MRSSRPGAEPRGGAPGITLGTRQEKENIQYGTPYSGSTRPPCTPGGPGPPEYDGAKQGRPLPLHCGEGDRIAPQGQDQKSGTIAVTRSYRRGDTITITQEEPIGGEEVSGAADRGGQ